ncbi:MAG TPA: hypothetical protein PK637_18840 [Flavobacteriales bacterium]|nr:N-acetyltransferase [Flavobacterium sp.]HRE73175.1 hypothetical protein [Flavobacteriales bacterium]HRE98827.1 hypothetical protein [Flavobacteriales bacterium]
MKFSGNFKLIGSNIKIGQNVKIGDGTIIYDNVSIGDNTIICNDCVIGEPIQDYYFNENYENPPCSIGANSLIRSHTIIYCNVTIGENFSTGHRVTIRENSIFGDHCKLGTLTDIQGYCTIGSYVWLHSNVHICQGAQIDNFVFIYPFVVLTNDPHPPSNICSGPHVGAYTQIAVSSVLLPDSRIGEHVLIGANSVVGGVVADYSLVIGNPAKFKMDVRSIKSKDKNSSTPFHYPWPNNFKRGMPWEELGFMKWNELTKEI